MRNVLRRRRLLFRPTGLAYLLRDDFDAPQAAPLPATRVCSPGPGTLTITDSESKLSVASGALVLAPRATPTNGDPLAASGAAYARTPGRACVCKVTPAAVNQDLRVGFADANNDAFSTGGGVRLTTAGQFRVQLNAALNADTLGAYAAATPYVVITAHRSAGSFIVVSGGAYGTGTLLWAGTEAVSASSYVHISNFSSTGTVDYLRVLDLGGAFASDYGLATQRLAGSQAAGTTFSHAADCLAEFTVTTRPTAGSALVFVRRQDASNYWQAEVNSAGDFLLKEVVAGTPTTRGTAAAVVTSGHRCVVIAEGATIRGFSNNTLRWTYASASNFQTATAGQLNALGTGGVVSDVIAWPRNVSGYLPAGL